MLAAGIFACLLALGTARGTAVDDPKGKMAPEEVYILGQDLIKLLEQDPDAVILVGEQAQKYIEGAKDRERAGSQTVLIQQCRIRGELLEDQAQLQLDLTVRSQRDERSPVPIGLAEANLLSASIDGGPPFLTRDAAGWVAWVAGQGQHTISLKLQLSVAGSKSLPALVCSIPEAAVTSLELRSLRAVSDVKLAPPAPVTVRAADGSKPQIEAALGPRGKLDLRWRWADGPDRDAPPLLRAVSEVAATVEPGVVQLKTELMLQALRNPLQSCELRTSADERVLDLRARDGAVIGWQTSLEGEEQRIMLHFSEPRASAELIVTSEVPWSGDLRTIRGIVVQGAHSHRAVLALRSAAEFDVAVTELVGARRTELLPATLRSPRNEAAFAAFAQPFQLKLSILPRRPVASVRTTAIVVCDDDVASVLVRWQFAVHGGRLSQVDFRLPHHFEAKQFVFTDAMQTVREEKSGEERIARVFLKGIPDEFELRLRATVPLVVARNLAKLDLPWPRHVQHDLSRVYLGSNQDLALDATPDFQPVEEPLDAAAGRELPDFRTLHGFQTRAPLDRISFRLYRTQPAMRHQTHTQIAVSHDYLTVAQSFEYAVPGIAVHQLRFAVPKSLTGAVKLGPTTGQLLASSTDSELRIQLEGESPELLRVHLNYRVPLAVPEADGQTDELIVPMVSSLDGPCDFTYVTIVAPWSLDLRVSGKDWRPVAPAAPQTNVEGEGIQVSVRRVGSSESIPVLVATRTAIATHGLVVDKALISTIVAIQGEWRTLARYWVTAGNKNRLSIRVPRGGQIRRVRWGGKPLPFEPGADAATIELISSEIPSATGLLEIESDGVATGGRTAWAMHRWEAPVLLGEVTWGRVFWHVSLPDRMVVLRGPRSYSNENRLSWRDVSINLVPRFDAATLERWLIGSNESSGPLESGNRLLFSRLLSVEPISLLCVSRRLLFLVASGSVVLLVPVFILSPRPARFWVGFVVIVLVAVFTSLEPIAASAAARSAGLGLVLAVAVGVTHAFLMRRHTPKPTVFPEPGALAKTHEASSRSSSEFALGRAANEPSQRAAETKTASPRPAGQPSSAR